MTPNTATNERTNGAGDGREMHYPLEKYIKRIPMTELSVDFSTLGKFPLSKEDLAKLNEINILVKLAEEEINNLALKSARQEGEVFHIEQPSYFDKKFDIDKYVKELVDAKFQGMKIVEHENATTKVQKMMLMQRALDNMKDDNSIISDAVILPKPPVILRTNIPTNVDIDKKQNENITNTPCNVKESKAANSVKFKSKDTKQTREDVSKTPIRKSLKSNHKVIEIMSIETSNDSGINESNINRRVIPGLSIEVMPSINIRSQLIEQKIPSLDIFPTDKNNSQPSKWNNIALVNTKHEDNVEIENEIKPMKNGKKSTNHNIQVVSVVQNNTTEVEPLIENEKTVTEYQKLDKSNLEKPSNNKVRKNNVESYMFLDRNNLGSSAKISKLKKYGIPEIQQIYNPKIQIHKRCPMMFSKPITSSNNYLSNISKQPVFLRNNSYKYATEASTSNTSHNKAKTEYIPYSKLTIGGYSVDEVEKKMRSKKSKSPQNVAAQDSTVKVTEEENDGQVLNESISDFDSEDRSKSSQSSIEHSLEKYLDDFDIESNASQEQQSNMPCVKKKRITELSFKSEIDIFDFVDYVEKKDDSTQSNPIRTVSYRGTQTSPEENRNNLDLENNYTESDAKKSPSFDVNNITLADMIQIRKVLSSLNSQMLSNNESQVKNADSKTSQDDTKNSEVDLHIQIPSTSSSMQKDTQTSPMRNKNVMTSPAKMIGQNLSPVFDDKKVDAETSPWDFERESTSARKSNEKISADKSVQLPSSSNFFTHSPKKAIVVDSTDEISHSESSESQSMGEINLSILRRKSLIIKRLSKSDSTSTSLGLSSNSEAHLDSSNQCFFKKSDGEISEGQVLKNA